MVADVSGHKAFGSCPKEIARLALKQSGTFFLCDFWSILCEFSSIPVVDAFCILCYTHSMQCLLYFSSGPSCSVPNHMLEARDGHPPVISCPITTRPSCEGAGSSLGLLLRSWTWCLW